jgi:hypothetical protein
MVRGGLRGCGIQCDLVLGPKASDSTAQASGLGTGATPKVACGLKGHDCAFVPHLVRRADRRFTMIRPGSGWASPHPTLLYDLYVVVLEWVFTRAALAGAAG